VHLTIDSDLQWFAQQQLAQQGTAVGADWATAFVVRVATGEIVVAADWPSIDPNDLDSVGPDDAGARSFVAPFEPGSIMKPVAFAALLDQGLITPDTQLVVPGRYTEGLPAGEYITDVFAHGDLRWTATGILMNSSNIGTVMLSNRLSLEERYEYFRKFGFGQPTEVDFLGESVPGNHGRVFTPGEIDTVSAATQMFGQGITATSAQMVSTPPGRRSR
jgi:cell division protein FtsI (penicillin-binding protein 3)